MWSAAASPDFSGIIMRADADTYEGLVDGVALTVFPKSLHVHDIEEQLWTPARGRSVHLAFLQFETMVERYLRLSIPQVVEEELLIQQKEGSLQDVLLNAPIYEAEYHRRRMQRERFAGAAQDEVLRADPSKPNPVPRGKCHGCAEEGHWRQECPYKSHRCSNCNRVGHISAACRARVDKDSVGRIRHMVEGSPSKVVVETRRDRTTADKVLTASDVLNQIHAMAQSKSQRAALRRGQQQARGGKEPKKDAHPR
eukprot:GHVN01002886.1.p1 GENE.GHVN01002886.1~~GHVN01002886.1.p1  ORF type:complete len:254 (-),score=10.54 GHVN01002886.1:134-895(-)